MDNAFTAGYTERRMLTDPGFLVLLACPKCHGELVAIGAARAFGCRRCALLFAVEHGIPNFLIDDARPWAEAAEQR